MIWIAMGGSARGCAGVACSALMLYRGRFRKIFGGCCFLCIYSPYPLFDLPTPIPIMGTCEKSKRKRERGGTQMQGCRGGLTVPSLILGLHHGARTDLRFGHSH